jgi:hypothetical protein
MGDINCPSPGHDIGIVTLTGNWWKSNEKKELIPTVTGS